MSEAAGMHIDVPKAMLRGQLNEVDAGVVAEYRATADQISNFDDYQARTTRQIPVVVLERRQP